MSENEISYIIRGCIYKVHNAIGPGLLESAYCAALSYELRKAGLEVKEQVGLPFIYEEVQLDVGYRIDLLVNNKVIIEGKSIESLAGVHYKQVLTYLKFSECKLGILVNFNVADINEGIKRVVNNL